MRKQLPISKRPQARALGARFNCGLGWLAVTLGVLMCFSAPAPARAEQRNGSGEPRVACPFPDLLGPARRSSSVALHAPGFSAPGAGESAELVQETYTSWQGNRYGMYGFDGQYTRVLVRTEDFPLLGKERMNELVDRCDLLYSNMRDLLGWEPGGDGRLSIALAVDTCGSGCGVVGGKGIEVEVDFQAYGAERIDGAYGGVWSVIIHEMAHNFDPVSGPIFYTPDTAHAWTSFLNFYAMVADGNGSLDHFPPFHRPAEVLDTMVDYFFDPYLEDPTASWSGCIDGGDCTFSSLITNAASKQGGAQGGLLLKFAQQAGPSATRRLLRHLINRVMTNPGQWVGRLPLDKAGLLAEAMSAATDGNAAEVFDRWKWGLSVAKRTELASAFPAAPSFAVDGDGDGVSVLAGDCDDHDPFAFPKAEPPLPELASDCDEFAALPLLKEDGDFPGFEEAPLPLELPVEISGAGQQIGDIDRFSFKLDRQVRLRFTLISSNTWSGWCLFDHTRVYGVYAAAGRTGRLSVVLGPGPIGIRMEPDSESQGVGDYRFRIEIADEPTPSTWLEPAGTCGSLGALPTLVETREFADLPEDAVPLRLPSRILGSTCSNDDEDWFSLQLEEPTALRIQIVSEGDFAGWVIFRPGNELAYAPARNRGGIVARFPAGKAVFRVVSQETHLGAHLGRYRVMVQREPDEFLVPPPVPKAMPDGTWLLGTGRLAPGLRAEGATARFWLAGRGWVGTAQVVGGEAFLRLALPPEADPYSLAYRFQLYREGDPVSPATPRRAFGGTGGRLPIRLAGEGLVPASRADLYDATIGITRGESPVMGPVQVWLDGRRVLNLDALPPRIQLFDLGPGNHVVRLQIPLSSGGVMTSAPYPFVIFRSPELNLVPGHTPPIDARLVRRVQELEVASGFAAGDLEWFEDLRQFRSGSADARMEVSLFDKPRLRFVSAPGMEPRLGVESLPGHRVRVRGLTFGRLGVLQRSTDLVRWTDVPYTANPDPNQVIEVDLPGARGPEFFRISMAR